MWCDELGGVVYRVYSRHVHIVCRSYNGSDSQPEWRGMSAHELSDWCSDSDPDGVPNCEIMSMGSKYTSWIHLHGRDIGDSRWVNITGRLSELLCVCECGDV